MKKIIAAVAVATVSMVALQASATNAVIDKATTKLFDPESASVLSLSNWKVQLASSQHGGNINDTFFTCAQCHNGGLQKKDNKRIAAR